VSSIVPAAAEEVVSAPNAVAKAALFNFRIFMTERSVTNELMQAKPSFQQMTVA
jgi:hypothetical protein